MRLERIATSSVAKKLEYSQQESDHQKTSLCQKKLSNRNALKDHLKATKFFCDICPKFYSNRTGIAVHMSNVHSEKRFACNVCDYKTARKGDYQKHKAIHAARVQCPVCKKPVTALKEHMRYHKPKERCSICQKMLVKRSLKAHMDYHKRYFKCRSCVEVFKTKEDFRR